MRHLCMLAILLSAGLLVGPKSAAGAPVEADIADAMPVRWSHLPDMPAMLSRRGPIAVIADARLGDGPEQQIREITLRAIEATPLSADDRTWATGRDVNFTFTYDPESGLVTFTLAGRMVSCVLTDNARPEAFIRTHVDGADAEVQVREIKVNGHVVEKDCSADAELPQSILWLRGSAMESGFVITGVCRLTWDGEPDEQQLPGFEIHLGHDGWTAYGEFSGQESDKLPEPAGLPGGSTPPGGGLSDFDLWAVSAPPPPQGGGYGGFVPGPDPGPGPDDDPYFAPPRPDGGPVPDNVPLTAAPAPEPATLVLLGLGATALAVGGRRLNRRRK